ncbi:MAG: FMN-binding protein [Acidobacteriota bacterium]
MHQCTKPFRHGRWRRRTLAVLFFLYPAGVLGGPVISREEALAAAYSEAAIEAERIFLTERQLRQAEALCGEEIPSPLIARYTAIRDGKIVGRAYIDTHVVRTKNESLLICLDQAGKVRRIEVTAFMEPPEYQASEAWLNQYRDKHLSDDLHLQRSIRAIAGATLTALAANRAVRRVLAIDRVLTQTVAHSRAKK